MILNIKQKEFYDLALDPNMKGKMVMLQGSAGTGKSYCLKTIGDQYIQQYAKPITGCAPSHKAKTVLKELGIDNVETIHSFLGLVMKKEGYTMKLAPNNSKKVKVTGLLIVDEVSMLTPEIFSMIKFRLHHGYYERVILVGDPYQIPSIGETVNYEDKNIPTITLTEQMRQDPTKQQLSEYLLKLRNSIINNNLPDIINTPNEIEYITDFDEFAKKYKECTTEKMIIAYKNKTVNSYNNNIIGNIKFSHGDRVVLDKPYGEYKNQEILTIDHAEKEADRYVISFIGVPGKVYHYHSQIKLNSLLETYVDAEDIEGYWGLKDKCFSLKHIYAQSAHKSQGSSYETVFVDGKDIIDAHYTDKTRWNHPISEDLMKRLLYVAISRMRSKAYVYIGENRRNYKTFKKVWR